MMTATHMLIGIALGYIFGLSQPDLIFALTLTGLAGGLLPDLDILFEHNKTLHFPAYYSLLGAISVTAAIFLGSTDAVLATVLFGAAALHCFTDVFVGSIGSTVSGEKKDSTVYLHPERRWLGGKDLIRFSGSPEDLATSLLIGVPLILVLPDALKLVVAGILILGLIYTFFQVKEYRRYLKKQDAPTIQELFEEAKDKRSK